MTSHNVGFFKTWAIAVRPFAYTASVSAVFLGLALAYYDGYSINVVSFLLTLLGVVCFHTGANLLSDKFDFQRGIDTEVLPTSGAIVRGLLTLHQVTVGAFLFFGVGILAGLALIFIAGIEVLYLGIAGAIVSLTYTGRGFCLKYIGLGDLGIFLAFGFLPVVGTYFVQTGEFSLRALLWSLPVVFYTVGILHANNWRDIDRDLRVGCTTFAGFIGKSKSYWYYQALVFGPFLLSVIFALWFGPLLSLVVLVFLPIAYFNSRNAMRDTKAMNALDGATAKLQLLFAVALILSLVSSKIFL